MSKMSTIHAQEHPSSNRPFTRRDFLKTSLKVGAAAFTAGVLPKQGINAQGQYNVLFINIDDLNTMLGCYGHPEMRTPNIDQLAELGTLFNRAYCQFPLCNPSRASVLTGLRPDTTGIKTNDTAEGDTFGAVTAPQYFKAHGYHTRSVGKIAHGWLAWEDKVSWSAPIWRVPYKSGSTSALSWQALDVADNELRDGKIASRAIEVLAEIKDLPFFLAVGFDKPHVPFEAPSKYFDLYTPEDFTLPAHSASLPENVPLYALRANPQKLSDAETLELTRAYAACISYIDAQVGRILKQLQRLGLTEKTLIVLWSDHGFHLGEHATWQKNTLFEVGLRVPLIVSVPDQSSVGIETDAFVELVDIFPTLCDACQLPVPTELEGQSMLPVIENSAREWKSATFSQIRRRQIRNYYHNNTLQSLTGIDLAPDDSVDGYSMRTERYRYTEWAGYSAQGEKIADISAELYDYQTDPDETVNIASFPENAELVTRLSERLHAGWQAALPEMHQQTPVPQIPPWDINSDGIIDIQDLVLVSNSFGTKPPKHPRADVNQDGNVDIIDLLFVAAHFGESTSPAAPQGPAPLLPKHVDHIEKWLTEARLTDNSSDIFRQGIASLEALLNSAIPQKSALWPNYPNPFNPETWIPYDLAEDADVYIQIYNLKGESVRHLSIGFQSAGIYRTQSRAAYWDGRNSVGEWVASGTYFCVLTARYKNQNLSESQFSATRRMVIVK